MIYQKIFTLSMALGVPLFGLNNDSSVRECRICRDKMREWVLENGGEYDNSEPKLFLPETQFKKVQGWLKSY